MKTVSNDLYQIIAEMSAPEMLYYRRNATEKKVPIYIKLYDTIVKYPGKEESFYKKLVKKAIPGHKFAYHKNYLLKSLQNALVGFYLESDTEGDDFKQLMLVRIYISKHLIDAAESLCRKLMQKSLSEENYMLHQLAANEYQNILLYFSTKNLHFSILNHAFEENAAALKQYNAFLQYKNLYYELMLIRRKHHFKLSEEASKRIAAIEQNPIYVNPPESASFITEHYYRMICATVLYLQGNTESFKHAEANMVMWQSHPQKIKTLPENYIEACYILNYTSIQALALARGVELFAFDAAAIIEGKANKAYYECIRALALFKIYHKSAAYNNVAALLKEVVDKYDLWIELINVDLKRTLTISLAISYFVLGNFENAFYFTKKGISFYNDKTRKEHFAFAYLLLLLIHFELHDELLFEAHLNSTYAYFRRNKSLQPFEKLIIDALRKAIKLAKAEDRKPVFSNLLAELVLSKEDEIQKRVFEIFNFPLWFESKIADRDYKELVTERLRAEN